jgi:hypothetical protein
VLGAVVEAVDGRASTRTRAIVAAPLGLGHSRLGIPVDEQGHSRAARPSSDRPLPSERRRRRNIYMAEYRIDWRHNERHIAVSPAAGCAARELGRFYESLLGYGPGGARAATAEDARCTDTAS